MMWATTEARQTIAQMLVSGATASQIGARFRVSRNAVVGIVHRDEQLREIGFARSPSRRTTDGPTRSRRTSYDKARAPRMRPSKNLPIDFDYEPLPVATGTPHCVGLPSFWDLEQKLFANQCRWIVNEAEKGGIHLFCAMPSDGAWCPHHRKLVYRPAEKRKAA